MGCPGYWKNRRDSWNKMMGHMLIDGRNTVYILDTSRLLT